MAGAEMMSHIANVEEHPIAQYNKEIHICSQLCYKLIGIRVNTFDMLPSATVAFSQYYLQSESFTTQCTNNRGLNVLDSDVRRATTDNLVAFSLAAVA
eukprot:scaffold487014_cov18-Prasinocladus_malaysianus.AAC.1